MDSLERFVIAQNGHSSLDERGKRFLLNQGDCYQDALEEIRSGRKRSHWIWYIFPQLKGLGHSYYSDYYGIADIEEAKNYLKHPVLGARLREISNTFLSLSEEKTAREILGNIDAVKVKSSMTLFYLASKEQLFLDIINRYYEGKFDKKTIKLLSI